MITFSYRITFLWRMIFASATLGALISSLWFWYERGRFVWPPTGAVMAGAACLVLVSLWFYRIRVRPEGLTVINAWGFPQQLEWLQILKVEEGRFWLIPAFRLTTVDGQSYWLYREIKDASAFYSAVVQRAGEHHPLAKVLAQPAHRLI